MFPESKTTFTKKLLLITSIFLIFFTVKGNATGCCETFKGAGWYDVHYQSGGAGNVNATTYNNIQTTNNCQVLNAMLFRTNFGWYPAGSIWAYQTHDLVTCTQTDPCNGDGEWNDKTFTCDVPCNIPDSIPSDNPEYNYDDWTESQLTCSNGINNVSYLETKIYNCVESYRCKYVPDSDGDGIDNSQDTDDDNDGYSDDQEEQNQTDKNDANSQPSGVTPDGGGSNSGNASSSTSGCFTTCGVENSACYDVHHGGDVWSHTLAWQDCTTCEELTGQYSGKCPELGLDDLCKDVYKGINEVYNSDCTVNCITGYSRDSNGDCIEDIPEINDCSNPPTYHGFTFQNYTTTWQQCDMLGIAHGGGNSEKYPLANCNLGKYACYYNVAENNGDDDLNTTSTDLNGSTIIDDTNIVNGLQNVSTRIDTTNNKLSSIDSSINIQTSTLGSKLDVLNDTVGQSNNNVRDAVNNANRDLGSKILSLRDSMNANSMTSNTLLNDIKNNTSPTGTVLTDGLGDGTGQSIEVDTDKVDGIKGAINDLTTEIGDTGSVIDEVKTTFTEFTNNIQTALTTFTDDLAVYEDMFSFQPTVELPSSGTCAVGATVPLFNTTFDPAENLCGFLQIVAPFFQFIFTLVTQLGLIYIYIRYFRVWG